MLKVFLVVTAAVLVAGVAIGYLSGLFSFGSDTSEAPANPSPMTTSPPPPSPETSPITVTPTIPEPPTTTPSPEGYVEFEFVVTGISGSGLSRTVSAQVTNSGDSDAHNVWVEVAVLSQGSLIKINGEESLTEEIGTIKAGQTVERQVSLSFSILDGVKIQKNGVTLTLTINSDEFSDMFSYDYSV